MALLVINEWLPEDSSGINGQSNQRDALIVMSRLAVSEHQLVIVESSPFEQKFWNLCKNNVDIAVRGIVRAYLLGLRGNQDRCRILRPDELAVVPPALLSATKADDHYLLHAQQTVPEAIIVTTDIPLRAAVTDAGLACISREQFLSAYF